MRRYVGCRDDLYGVELDNSPEFDVTFNESLVSPKVPMEDLVRWRHHVDN